MLDILTFLEEEGVDKALLEGVKTFRAKFPTEAENAARVPAPEYLYYGKKTWELALAAILAGKNLLLAGPKATGKNVLSENLGALFGRPVWNVSFHINTDASYLVGTDTYDGSKVSFRPGPIWLCAEKGGFGILDEINMAKNEALAVLHAALDFRRSLDVPGYEKLDLRPETRFIATMNYGYAGTRDLNEALTSRFAVLDMPVITEENLQKLTDALSSSDDVQLNALLETVAGLTSDPAGAALRLKAIAETAKENQIYSTAPAGMQTSVMYVYQTPGIAVE